jgi:phosphate transport system permease protein
VTTLAPGTLATDWSDAKTRGVWGDRLFRALALGAGLIVLAVLALIAYTTLSKAWPAFRHEGFLGFLTSQTWDPNKNEFGALQFIFGTIVSATIAITFAVPLSFGIALFITEVAPRRVRIGVTYVIDLLAAIPSVVYGFWALAAFTQPVTGLYWHIADTIGTLPVLNRLFGGPVRGACFMTAGVILAIMITPIITSLSREVLLTVPQEHKNGALAMGATRWEMLRVAVFPRVRSGLIGSVMLGLGRAMGETIAVALVIGSSRQLTSHLFRSGDTITSVIVHNFPETTGLPRGALIGLGAVLFLLTIVINVLARIVTNRTMRASGLR